MKAFEKKLIVSATLATVADVAYSAASSRQEAGTAIGQIYRLGSSEDFDKACIQYLAGRIVGSLEHPDHRLRKQAEAYTGSQWSNYDRAQRYEAATEMVAKKPADSADANRRTKFEQQLVGAARSALSDAKRIGGVPAKNAGGRKPRTPANKPVEGASVSVASPKFGNDNEAVEHFNSVMAALATTCEINLQTGSKKDVKRVAFAVQSIILDAKTAIAKALA